jgi:hypothetical protein
MEENTVLDDLEIEIEELEAKVAPSGFMDWGFPF